MHAGINPIVTALRGLHLFSKSLKLEHLTDVVRLNPVKDSTE